MSSYRVLSRAEIGTLADAGDIEIHPHLEGALNQLLMLWLTGEDERLRLDRLAELAIRLASSAAALEKDLSEGSLDRDELLSRARRFQGSDFGRSVDLVVEHAFVLKVGFAELSQKLRPLPPGRGHPKQDWATQSEFRSLLDVEGVQHTVGRRGGAAAKARKK